MKELESSFPGSQVPGKEDTVLLRCPLATVGNEKWRRNLYVTIDHYIKFMLLSLKRDLVLSVKWGKFSS